MAEPKLVFKTTGRKISFTPKDGNEMILELANKVGLRDFIISNTLFSNITPEYMCLIANAEFENCEFRNCNFTGAYFLNCKMRKCKFTEGTNTEQFSAVDIDNVKKAPILTPTNEQIESTHHCKVYALPNKSFVKVKWTCDFCHNDYYDIYRRDRVTSFLRDVPNCPKHVCPTCFESYRLRDKFQGCRVYGYRGTVSKYTTPIDNENTAIIGLEMEFEGDFYGWKELQDAHKGKLHYGYDSSVIGQNELSWDCGSYSWWKYLSPLKDVCSVLGKYGGRAGRTAGIHIHVSRDDKNVAKITEKINAFGQTAEGKALFEAISLRDDKERFRTYSNLDAPAEAHHAGISYNSYNTCEFRLFNSTLDYRLVLKHIKFCKEVFNAFADSKSVWNGFSSETITHIKECASTQVAKGFITEEQYNLLLKKLK